MDAVNTFETPATYRAMRVEYGLLAAACGYLLLHRRKEVRWPIALGLFLYNDTLGYVPGAIAYRRSRDKSISKAYYAAYNIMHSGVTAAIVAAVWARFVRREWAMLGIPLHIGIDRAVFGNMLKPYSVPFEPEPHPVWQMVREQLQQPWQGMSVAETQIHTDGAGSRAGIRFTAGRRA
jgi:hypothetical protein